MIHDTQIAQISQKQDGHIYMQSWKQCALPPSRLSPQWLCGNWCTWAHDVHDVVHDVANDVVITVRAHCFHDCIYICPSCFCEIWYNVTSYFIGIYVTSYFIRIRANGSSLRLQSFDSLFKTNWTNNTLL